MANIVILWFILFVLESSADIIDDIDDEESSLFQGYLLNKMKKSIPDIIQKWKEYKEYYNMTIPLSESRSRFFVFGKNLIFIKDFMERGDNTFSLEPNRFIFFSREEYFKILGTFDPNVEPGSEESFGESGTRTNVLTAKSLPDKDWRKQNVVTAVKDQAECGGCYAFSSIATVESAIAIKTRKLNELSEQSIIDCSERYGNSGCNGGILEKTFEYMTKNQVPLSSKYPYTAKDGTCKLRGSDTPPISKYRRIRSYDEDDLSSVVSATGPVAVAIDARYDSFKFYKKGIMYERKCSQTVLNHGVTAVGIGSSPEPYYIVKNSYGTKWGMSGYIHMSRYRDNNCGIATAASYPIV